MVSFDGQTLFASGPSRFQMAGRALRHAVGQTPGSLGSRVVGQGLEGRRIRQTGTLIADSTEQLQQQMDAIELKLDGLGHVLVDDAERSWPNTVMLKFETKALNRVATRWKVAYSIEYLQVMAE
jgi:hypothetical protein